MHDDHGAGLDLNPEPGGVRVESVLPVPGQPGLNVNDMITNINEASTWVTLDRVEYIFGTHFRAGAQIGIPRDASADATGPNAVHWCYALSRACD